jgi:hypothetical protein
MNPYQILQISPSATNDEIISAHRKLNSMAAIALKDKPDLYKLRKYSLELAMNQLLDNSKRTEIDKTLKSDDNVQSARSSKSSNKSVFNIVMYPFTKIVELLWFVFGPAAKYLAKIGVIGLRVGFFVFIIWSVGFAKYTEPYRKVALNYATVVYDDFGSVIPDIRYREYLPGFLGGRLTYNSSACEKIRLKIYAMEKIILEEEKKSGALKTLGFGAALIKLAQGDTAKAKEYGGKTSRSTSKTDNEIRSVKASLDRVRIDNLECTKRPD